MFSTDGGRLRSIYTTVYRSNIIHTDHIGSLIVRIVARFSNCFQSLLPVLPTDNRSAERVHAATVAGRVSRRILGDGADGREPVPGDTDGSGSRAHVLPALSDALRHQALTLGRYHSQGECRKTSSPNV